MWFPWIAYAIQMVVLAMVSLVIALFAEPVAEPAVEPVGTVGGSSDPLAVESHGPFTSVGVNVDDACALTEAGDAICWFIGDSRVSTSVTGPFISIASGDGPTCAVTKAGEIQCWDPTGQPIPAYADDPSRNAPLGVYSTLSYDAGYSCAITVDGKAVCWALKSFWEDLAPPDPPDDVFSSIVVNYWNNALGSLYLTVCGLTVSGEVVCWAGSNSGGHWQSVKRYAGPFDSISVRSSRFCAATRAGELVLGSQGRTTPGCIYLEPDPADTYVAVSSSNSHTCVLTADGQVVCSASSPILGSGALQTLTPPDMNGERVAQISVGRTTGIVTAACALTERGSAVCWWSEDNRVDPPETAPGRYIDVSDGWGHTCGLTEGGAIACWGWNNWGQTDVPEGRYRSVSAGFATTCALTDRDALVCWGSDAQLSRYVGNGPFKDAAVGASELCVLSAHGEAVCVEGLSNFGLESAPAGRFESISLGLSGNACALNEIGAVACWGNDRYGQAEVPRAEFQDVDAALSGFVCGVTATGKVQCWGDAQPRDLVWRSDDYVRISSGGAHACALRKDGEAECRGSFRRSIADVDYGSVNPPPARFSRISSSGHRSCGVTVEGDILCWGDAEYEQWPQFSH